MDTGNPYLSQINDAATKYGVDPTLALGVANQESRFNNKAVSPKGAQGIFQLMPDTAKDLGVDPSDPAQNIDGGVRYLKQMQDRYNGDPQLTLAAYNAGPARVDDYVNKGRPLPAETTDYVNKISGSPIAAPSGAMKQAFAQAGNQPMPDPTQPQAQQPPQDPSTLSTLFGGNPTPVGGIAAIARMLGIGSEPNLGRSLQNAGAALQAPGNWGRSGAEGAAAMQNAANAPHFQVVPTADGSRIVIDTRTGQPISANGRPVGSLGAAPGTVPADGPGQTPNAQNTYNEDLAKQSADEMTASTAAYEAAKNTKALAAQARSLVNDPGLSLGASGELRNEAKKYLKQYTGVDLGGVDQGDQFGTLAQTFAANQAKQMGVTRYAGPEIAMAARSSISENNTKEANLQHISDLEHLADRTMAQHEARVAYAKAHNGILGPGFQAQLDEADKQTPTYGLNPGMQSAPQNRPPLSDIFK